MRKCILETGISLFITEDAVSVAPNLQDILHKWHYWLVNTGLLALSLLRLLFTIENLVLVWPASAVIPISPASELWRAEGRWGLPALEFVADAVESKGRAQFGVAGVAVTDDFSLGSILLVSERECGGGEPGQRVRIMQRCGRSGVDFVGDGEVDVLEFEGLGAECGRVGVFGRAEEEEEHDDDEVDDDFVVHSFLDVGRVENVWEDLDECGIGWVGPLLRVVLVAELLEERSKYGDKLVGVRLEAGIQLTQVGDARAHGQKGFTH